MWGAIIELREDGQCLRDGEIFILRDGVIENFFLFQWVEESFTNFQKGINWRSYVVCDVAYNNVNNWLWTPFIDRGVANRIYIEIKFTIRDCSLFPGKRCDRFCS